MKTSMGELQIVQKYKEVAIDMLKYSFPNLKVKELNEAVDYSIAKRMKNSEAILDNNYKKVKMNTTLIDMCEYILSREPIITPYGVMFKRHGEAPNPIAKMLEKFMDGRSAHKKEMFKYPKGSEMFEHYNLLQLLDKIDCNAFYGACGQFSCIYYNLHVATSVTSQGRSLISSAGLLFEMFLANSVQFGSLNEVVTFIHNVVNEKRTYDDSMILDDNITLEETFYKICINCGFEWVPTEKELLIIWEIMMNLTQQDLNRLYYKNNLYSFMDNHVPTNAMIQLLTMLDKPYLDPNSVPEEIKSEIEVFWGMLKEYVYYSYQIIDRTDRLANMVRSVTAIIDTDSNIISLDAWYHYVLEKVQNAPMKIYAKANVSEFVAGEEFDMEKIELNNQVEVEDFDFYNEDIVMSYRMNVAPTETSGQDNLRYSIINILCYCLSEMINDYMVKYTENSHSAMPDRKCLMIMKNEFLFSRALLTDAKKTYASIQELQEGNIVGKALDVKGLDVLTKSTTNEATRKRLREIMYEDILKTQNIDQVQVLKQMAITERKMFDSLMSGSKEYYKPAVIKSIANYENPMRIQGIKGAVAFNALRGEYDEPIDFEKRNAVDIVKVDITPTNVEKIKDQYPEVYIKLNVLMKTDKYSDLIADNTEMAKWSMEQAILRNNDYFAGGIRAISIPLGIETPDWILEFIDYKTIINDNISGFPLESIGLHFAGGNVNYTNILKI